MMNIKVIGTDYNNTPLDLRGNFSFSNNEIYNILEEIKNINGINGVIMLATCNRCEIYIDYDNYNNFNNIKIIKNILLSHAEENGKKIESDFFEKSGEDACRYIIEVACGIHSQIVHDEQIVTQVGNAAKLARMGGFSDSVLNKLFQIAVTAGKSSQTDIRFNSVPTSAAEAAYMKTLEFFGNDISEKKILIIGNGIIGRKTAEYFVGNCKKVFITLRNYGKHDSDSIVPKGVVPVFYEDRIKTAINCDAVISATKSPHFTVTYNIINNLKNSQKIKKLKLLIDLAVPNDIEKSCGEIIPLFTLDDLGTTGDKKCVLKLYEISDNFYNEFIRWKNYHDSLEYIKNIQDNLRYMIQHSKRRSNITDYITNIIFGNSQITPEKMKKLSENISKRKR